MEVKSGEFSRAEPRDLGDEPATGEESRGVGIRLHLLSAPGPCGAIGSQGDPEESGGTLLLAAELEETSTSRRVELRAAASPVQA